jgi:hypothetical protein
MAFDAFISHSVKDKPIADAACATLEGMGIRCWMAPRDIPPGSEWAGSIIDAIDNCRIVVLIFSSHANISHQVHREVERAVAKGRPIFPLRIEEVKPTRSMEYYLGAIHWLDALTPPLEKHLNHLGQTAKACLEVDGKLDDTFVRSHTAKQGFHAAPGRSDDQAEPRQLPPARLGLVALGVLCIIIAAGGALFYAKRTHGTAQNPDAHMTPAQSQASAPSNQEAAAPPANAQPAAPVLPQTTTTAQPPGPSPDEAAWNLIKDAGDAELLRRFIQEFPDSSHRADAEQRIEKLASLPNNTLPPAPPPPPPVTSGAPPSAAKLAQPHDKQAHSTTKSAGCFMFNGRQVCE